MSLFGNKGKRMVIDRARTTYLHFLVASDGDMDEHDEQQLADQVCDSVEQKLRRQLTHEERRSTRTGLRLAREDLLRRRL